MLFADGQDTVRSDASRNVGSFTTVTTRPVYYPYGQYTQDGTLGTPGSRGYLDKQLDPSGDLRLDERDYTPELDQLTTPDPLLFPGDPLSANPYTYSENNPMTMSDPSGLMGNPGGEPGDGSYCIDGVCPQHEGGLAGAASAAADAGLSAGADYGDEPTATVEASDDDSSGVGGSSDGSGGPGGSGGSGGSGVGQFLHHVWDWTTTNAGALGESIAGGGLLSAGLGIGGPPLVGDIVCLAGGPTELACDAASALPVAIGGGLAYGGIRLLQDAGGKYHNPDQQSDSGTDSGNEQPPGKETIHSTVRGGGGERDIESSEVIRNAEHIYYDENGNQVYRESRPGGTSQIVIRNPANGNILTNQRSSDAWVEKQIQSGRWYDLQGR